MATEGASLIEADTSGTAFHSGNDVDFNELCLIRLKFDVEKLHSFSDWPSLVILNCYMCGEEIESVNSSVEHAREFHPDTYNVEKPNPCSVCPKTFSKLHHLYQHIWHHLHLVYPDQIPMACPLSETSTVNNKVRKKRSKLEEVSFETLFIHFVFDYLYGAFQFKLTFWDFMT